MAGQSDQEIRGVTECLLPLGLCPSVQAHLVAPGPAQCRKGFLLPRSLWAHRIANTCLRKIQVTWTANVINAASFSASSSPVLPSRNELVSCSFLEITHCFLAFRQAQRRVAQQSDAMRDMSVCVHRAEKTNNCVFRHNTSFSPTTSRSTHSCVHYHLHLGTHWCAQGLADPGPFRGYSLMSVGGGCVTDVSDGTGTDGVVAAGVPDLTGLPSTVSRKGADPRSEGVHAQASSSASGEQGGDINDHECG